MPAETICDVWWAGPVAPEDGPALVELLDGHERERLGRFRRPADRARYLAAHALTRLVLADATGRSAAALRFDRTCRCGLQHGKPTLPGGPDFSLTHGGDLVGVAVRHGGPVGLDVEPVREMADLDGMARHIYSPAELAAARPAAPGTFFTAWTRKEALLKATGDGIATPMSTITLGVHDVLDWTGDGAPIGPVWFRDLRPAAGYRAALAGIGAAPDVVREHDGRPLITPAA